MRFILYNMRYATGPSFHRSASSSGKNLQRIADFLSAAEPDLVGLVEVDHGSYRSGGKNQAELLASELGHYHSYSVKYGQDSLWRHVPVLKKQGNAFLARDRIRDETFHFFNKGMKRLVIELEMQHVIVYLVHLSLGAKARHLQLNALYQIVKQSKLPCIVAGDFNMLWGEKEIEIFLAATGLRNANRQRLPTYPSSNPQRHLDFILYSKGISIRKFQVPDIRYSDHRPVLVDFDVEVRNGERAETRPTHCSCIERIERLLPLELAKPEPVNSEHAI
ncbi:MAG: endonuclease [Desulfuromonas sp.]|nr:MAG: endonuclease [Desulfuromonas sp.]